MKYRLHWITIFHRKNSSRMKQFQLQMQWNILRHLHPESGSVFLPCSSPLCGFLQIHLLSYSIYEKESTQFFEVCVFSFLPLRPACCLPRQPPCPAAAALLLFTRFWSLSGLKGSVMYEVLISLWGFTRFWSLPSPAEGHLRGQYHSGSLFTRFWSRSLCYFRHDRPNFCLSVNSVKHYCFSLLFVNFNLSYTEQPRFSCLFSGKNQRFS